MSETATPADAALLDYVARHTVGDDPFLHELKQAAQVAGLPSIWIAPEQASLLQILLRSVRAREVLEVGTLAGYSAICMARALPPGGHVRSIELEPRHADFAQDWIGRSDVAQRIQLLRGDARQLLPTLADGSADAAFLDADKSGYREYLDQCLRIVRPGGLIMVDNAFAFGRLLDPECHEPEVEAVRSFNQSMHAEPRLHGTIVPVGDGMWVAVVLTDEPHAAARGQA